MKIVLKICLIVIITLIVLFAVVMVIGINMSKNPELSEFTVKSNKLPESFNGFRIAQISDFHNAEFGENNIELLELLKEAKPDIIVITGDLIDSRSTDINISLAFCKEAMKIAPCYYVPGNHESRIPQDYLKLLNGLEEIGVTYLNDEAVYLERGGDKIMLMGIKDPAFKGAFVSTEEDVIVKNKLERLKTNEDIYRILLSHRPEIFDVYCEENIDLIFSGHAHGGQIRLPLIGAVIVPHQRIFPKYVEGLYESGETKMLLSRGIGYSVINIRSYCKPQIILAVLENQES